MTTIIIPLSDNQINDLVQGKAVVIAQSALNTINEKVYSDWRLPTIQELKTLVNYNRHNPACDLEDIISDYYWSSSIYASNTDGAWTVDFNYGTDSPCGKTKSYYVRCVRNGENDLEWSASSESTMTWNEALKYAENLVAPVYYANTNSASSKSIMTWNEFNKYVKSLEAPVYYTDTNKEVI